MTKYREIDGVKYAEGIEPAPDGSDSEVAAELQKPAKMRITTMVDEDVYAELKRRALAEGDGRYQTYLNQLLRESLLQAPGKVALSDLRQMFEILASSLKATTDRMERVEKLAENLRTAVNAIEEKSVKKHKKRA